MDARRKAVVALEAWEKRSSSSSTIEMVRFKVGVAGSDGGGVGSRACSGMIVYSPSLERKSCWSLASCLKDEIKKAYWYSTAGTDSCAGDDNHLVRAGENVGNVL